MGNLMGTRVCTNCKEEKSLTAFGQHTVKGRVYYQPYCKPCHSKRTAEWLRKNPGYTTAWKRKRNGGFDAEKIAKLLDKQNGLCGICEEELGGKFDCDHDKESGYGRGLLCSDCNKGIGFLKHDKKVLQRAIDYLEEWEL
jgi:hypothetical protein